MKKYVFYLQALINRLNFWPFVQCKLISVNFWLSEYPLFALAKVMLMYILYWVFTFSMKYI